MTTPILRTRRAFLANCGVVAAGAALPQFLAHTAHAAAARAGWEAGSAAPLPGFKDGRILVVVQLSGGNDGLNTLVPHSDDAYFRARPRLAIKEAKRLRLNDDLSWNASLKPLAALYDEGKLAVVEGVGYPNPDRSHFRSMEIWHTAVDSENFSSTGWVGRYFDNHCKGRPQATAGVSVGGELPQVFDSVKGMGVAFQAPESFGYVAGPRGDDAESFKAMNRAEENSKNETLDFLRHVTSNAVISTERIQAISKKTKNAIKYPGSPLARDLSVVARMIAGGLGSRIYYVSFGGFDTHANQAGQHDRLLQLYAAALSTFQRDLVRQGLSERVVTMTFSEFGRRAAENASGGTDHGTAAPMFVLGDSVLGGLKGARPSLTDLDNGDLKFTTDFRSVYASVLRGWFDIDPATVLGRKFPLLDLVSV